MNLRLLLVVIVMTFILGCAPSSYQSIRQCNDRVDLDRLEHPEWNRSYTECIYQEQFPF